MEKIAFLAEDNCYGSAIASMLCHIHVFMLVVVAAAFPLPCAATTQTEWQSHRIGMVELDGFSFIRIVTHILFTIQLLNNIRRLHTNFFGCSVVLKNSTIFSSRT